METDEHAVCVAPPAARPSLVRDAANLLSLSRIALAAIVWVRPESAVFLLAVVAIAALTDGLDGLVGRKTHAGRVGTANVGAWLDPLCDKIFVCSAAAAVVVTYDVSLTVLALITLRDVSIAFLVLGFRLAAGARRFHRHDFRARPFGKATMAAQLVTLGAVVAMPPAVMSLALATALLGIAAVVERVLLVVRDLRADSLSRRRPTDAATTAAADPRGRTPPDRVGP